MSRCTWKGCENEAKHEQVSQDQGDVWANLCDDHVVTLYDAIKNRDDVNRIRAAWIDAQGGHEQAMQRVQLRRLRATGFAR